MRIDYRSCAAIEAWGGASAVMARPNRARMVWELPRIVLSLLCLFCLGLTACVPDPINNAGTWRVPDKGLTSNDENLRAMLVNPGDLNKGKGDPNSVGVTAGEAVRREITNRRFPLPASSTARGVEQQQGSGQQGQPQQQGAGAAPSREE